MSNSDTEKVSLSHHVSCWHYCPQVHTLVIKMMTAGLDQHLLDNILTLSRSVVPHSLQMSSLMREALETSLSRLRYRQIMCVFTAIYISAVSLISDEKYPNKKILLAISNMLKSCQNR